ncbi:MAG: 1-acyl-sn-glycerol-3-phosphate acyltransferase [Myxococcales bacterium]|nr:1-acyl-sn-glycerol-3-phosphate acyltransferase [Myxococcales bacterium]
MILPFSQWVFATTEWTVVGGELSNHRRCVVTAAPHTSNWDMIYMVAAFDRLGLPVRFTIKEEWMRFPFNRVIGPVGGVPINRRPREGSSERPSMTDSMVRLFEDNPGDFALAVTPEGTRSPRAQWKTGFWHVARRAEVPILLGYLDYGKREAGVGKVLYPTDLDADMRTVNEFYARVTPRYPEFFLLDEKYGSGLSLPEK